MLMEIDRNVIKQKLNKAIRKITEERGIALQDNYDDILEFVYQCECDPSIKKHNVYKTAVKIFMESNRRGNLLEIYKKILAIGLNVTLEKMTLYYGETLGLEKWNRYRNKQSETNASNSRNGSKPAKELFSHVMQAIPDLKDVDVYFLGNTDYEFGKYCDITNRYYFYDFVIPSLKFCVEYNGDVYHANPKKYQSDDVPRFRGNTRAASEIWEYDADKLQNIKNHGFIVKVVWDSEYQSNKQSVIQEVANEIRRIMSNK
jgi:very-short-patch-repair endonuclease